jgi:hypothetical protein
MDEGTKLSEFRPLGPGAGENKSWEFSLISAQNRKLFIYFIKTLR